MCKESHHKPAESIRGMLLDFSAALASKGCWETARRPPLLLRSRPEERLEWGRSLSWDWRHPPHHTLLFCSLAIAGFIFLCFPIHTAIRLDVTPPLGGSTRAPQHTHTPENFSPQRDQRRHSVGQNKDQLAVAWLVRWSFHVYFNGSLTPEKNSANVSFMKQADQSVSVCVYRTFIGVNLITGSFFWSNLRPAPPQKGIKDD